jgi:hypothetical protein
VSAPTEAEKIAARLTASDREALLNGKCGVPIANEEWMPECLCGALGGPKERLIQAGLAFRRERWPGGVVRTPLGLEVREEVRKILEREA